MKKTLILCIIFSSFTSFSFSQKINLHLNKVKLSEAFKEIRKEANVDFFYSDKEINVDKLITANYEDTEVLKIISDIVGGKYNVILKDDGIVLITPRNTKVAQEKITIKGRVTDDLGETLPGVAIIIKDTYLGTATNIEGDFIIKAAPDATLIFSYLGYQKQEVKVNNRNVINVQLKANLEDLEEVVITGIVKRKKESFTGAITSASREELQTVSNVNVVQGLKSLDPAFNVFENNSFGSNPNVLPDIEVRGKTSLTTDGLNDEFGNNPNQPLFILDGFETNLRTIVDLNMNRIESITVLKDATSTALYGAQAANGVVVVETIKPKPGDLRVNYNTDFSVQMPDLTDYVLMNSSQKLEYERLSERWTASTATDYQNQFKLDKQYNAILAEIKRGVDTYWLNEPLQIGTNIRNSLYVSGGSRTFTYGVGVNQRTIKGVMIGSERKNWGTTIDLNYRKDKWNISNKLYIDGTNTSESPYGSFSNFALANPYFKKTDDEGNITKYLDINNYFGNTISNPLYNATLNSYDTGDNFNVTNNTRAIYTLNNQVRFQANLQLVKGIDTNEKFVDPENTTFESTNAFRKGTYQNINTNNSSYKLNLMATYAKVYKKHRINANLRGEVEETNFDRLTINAEGFPYGTNGNPTFSYSYAANSHPTTALKTYRRINALTSLNYSYNKMFLVDATYRLDGSTVFGSNKKYSPFWSLGTGWNIHETFKWDPKVVSLFKLRGGIGLTGNQGFGNLSSVSIYQFLSNSNVFGQAVDIQTFANPNLEWQNTLQTSVGIDAVLFNNRLSATFNYYKKTTDPLIVRVDLPSSTGISSYPINAGIMNTQGIESYIKFSPIVIPEQQITWSLGLRTSAVKSKYEKFGNTLQSLNDGAQTSNSLLRYRDGYSPDDLWAVPSLGIDPSNGKEVFLTKEGLQTYEYNQSDEVVVGNSRPDMESILTSSLRIKNFTLNLNLRYRYGGEKFNTALFDKVENISLAERINNQDARALTERWIQPGDVARFKAINDFSNTPISSRFIQTENVLIGESFNVSYNFKNKAWLEKLKLNNLRLSAYMNDIFRISSVEIERGIQYPFARSVSFSLNAYF